MRWKAVEVGERGSIRVPKRWLNLHYYEALNILFRFENSLRVFVYIVLKDSAGCRWVDSHIAKSPDGAGTVRSLAAKRINMADNFGYLGYDVKAPLMHLTSGELVDLIVSDAHWKSFSPYFRATKDHQEQAS